MSSYGHTLTHTYSSLVLTTLHLAWKQDICIPMPECSLECRYSCVCATSWCWVLSGCLVSPHGFNMLINAAHNDFNGTKASRQRYQHFWMCNTPASNGMFSVCSNLYGTLAAKSVEFLSHKSLTRFITILS